jgi:hypothetical protein
VQQHLQNLSIQHSAAALLAQVLHSLPSPVWPPRLARQS